MLSVGTVGMFFEKRGQSAGCRLAVVGVTGDLVGGLLKPVGALLALSAELYLPLLGLLQVFAIAGLIAEPNAFAYISNSPMMRVGIFTSCIPRRAPKTTTWIPSLI